MAQNAVNRTASRIARAIHFVVPDGRHLLIDAIIELAIAPMTLPVVVHILLVAGSLLELALVRHRRSAE